VHDSTSPSPTTIGTIRKGAIAVPRLEMFRDRHQGERAVLVANGPSLNLMDLSVLRGETVIGLNKIYLGLRRFRFYPRYLVAVNRLVIEQAAADLRRLNCVKFISDNGKHVLPEDALTHHIRTRDLSCRFCRDITHGINEGYTVTYAALQIAFYMGFQEVVIVGMDHRFKYEGEPNEEQLLEGPDHNHFSPEYFGSGQRWQNPDLKRSEESYLLAKEFYEAAGRRIIDATVNGACTVFEKRDYQTLFGTVS
jgi:hypothetical protein